MSVTSNNRGHHHASDFIYASPYELIEKHADPNYGNSDIYVPASVSIRMTPPPLPQRNNNYSPPPRNKDRISSRSSSSTPPVTRAFPKTPSPINNDLKVVIEVHNEDRPSSLKQLQDMLETTNLISTTNSEDILPQEKDGFLSRKVGYEIERRLVKAVQVRTLRKKRQKKGHYHYYPFYEKQNYKGLWDWFKRQFNPNAGQIDHVYNTKRKHRRKRRKHHRFCMKCVTSSFSSLFRVLKEPIIVKTHSELYNDGQKIYNEENVSNLNLNQKNISGINQRAISRTATEATRTPTPKMLLDLKSGAIHWPVYQYGGQSGSGMLLSTKGLVSKKKNATENQEEIGRENFSLGGPVELLPPVLEDTKSSKRFLANVEEDERKLIGWLQVRDPNNRRKTFLQVVNPKPEGPFRKAPWHANVHVMKF